MLLKCHTHSCVHTQTQDEPSKWMNQQETHALYKEDKHPLTKILVTKRVLLSKSNCFFRTKWFTALPFPNNICAWSWYVSCIIHLNFSTTLTDMCNTISYNKSAPHPCSPTPSSPLKNAHMIIYVQQAHSQPSSYKHPGWSWGMMTRSRHVCTLTHDSS